MFYLNAVKVGLVLHMLQWHQRMLQVYVSNVSAIPNVSCKCFILMLNMLNWLHTHVAIVCFKCFSCFKRMLKIFYLDVAYVAVAIHICCKSML